MLVLTIFRFSNLITSKTKTKLQVQTSNYSNSAFLLATVVSIASLFHTLVFLLPVQKRSRSSVTDQPFIPQCTMITFSDFCSSSTIQNSPILLVMYLALSHTTVVQTRMCTYTCTIHAFSKHTELIGQISVPSQGGHGCICTHVMTLTCSQTSFFGRTSPSLARAILHAAFSE